ncbi:MAG: YggS family pyridoxal phosphate-dependent enzyme [Bacteroidota bacterium]
MSIAQNLSSITSELPTTVTLVAVSKTKPVENLLEAYNAGQRHFGENYIQELQEKQAVLPNDIRWHFIGHLQSNKVKYIAPYVHLVHGVDSIKLLTEINKQAAKNGRVIDCLLQVYIASEESKFGLEPGEVEDVLRSQELRTLEHIKIVGLMGMASFSEDLSLIEQEFSTLEKLFLSLKDLKLANVDLTELSMGMSSDYPLAVKHGSTLVRIGSSIFGSRNH